jgi:hypothetical protein
MSNTMTFRRSENGEMKLRRNFAKDIDTTLPISTAYIVDLPRIKESIKHMDFLNGKTLSITPMLLLGAVTVTTGGTGIFWDTFMRYIFPWMMDIAKVFCVIKIAQGFYEEKRGGKEGGTGMGTFVTYGKWYLLFMLIPWAVELIDQLGGKMLYDLKTQPMISPE